jgi:hypothetical protein
LTLSAGQNQVNDTQETCKEIKMYLSGNAVITNNGMSYPTPHKNDNEREDNGLIIMTHIFICHLF